MVEELPPAPRGVPELSLAYEDAEFLRSLDARSVRVLAELLQPQYRLRARGVTDTVVFFGSSRAPAPRII